MIQGCTKYPYSLGQFSQIASAFDLAGVMILSHILWTRLHHLETSDPDGKLIKIPAEFDAFAMGRAYKAPT